MDAPDNAGATRGAKLACVDDGTRHDAEVDDGVGRLMAWYTTDHARRDAERQALRRQQAGLLDKAETSKQVARYECIHCRALYSHTDERCPRCGAYEAVRSKTPNVNSSAEPAA